jgi:N utilization substance protein B
MLHVPDVPYRVAINEAVELAKEYGSTESRRFVNGVLGALVRKLNLDKTQRKRG